jgi:carbamate kinase
VRIVVALGGNALATRGASLQAAAQEARVAEAAAVLAPLLRENDAVVTHGNGPQIGWLALEAESAGQARPLDALGAETEGLVGYWLERELGSHLPERELATLLTRVEVDGADPAFRHPTKPIGPVLTQARARELAAERGWSVAPDRGGWRRVVASPEPRAVLALRSIELLLRAGVLVVCVGGGGIPVVRGADGRPRGVEAVIDKDLASALLATGLGAEALLLLTDVPGVYGEWPDRTGAVLRSATPELLRALRFDPGTMGPKVEAACRFVEAGGCFAAIGALADAQRVLLGEAGTRIAAAAQGEASG